MYVCMNEHVRILHDADAIHRFLVLGLWISCYVCVYVCVYVYVCLRETNSCLQHANQHVDSLNVVLCAYVCMYIYI